MCGGVFINLVFMVCGQYDMLYASLKNLSQIKILTDKIEFRSLYYSLVIRNQYEKCSIFTVSGKLSTRQMFKS